MSGGEALIHCRHPAFAGNSYYSFYPSHLQLGLLSSPDSFLHHAHGADRTAARIACGAAAIYPSGLAVRRQWQQLGPPEAKPGRCDYAAKDQGN